MALARIVVGLTDGTLLPSEATAIANIVESVRKSLESETLETRVETLEALMLKPNTPA